MKISFIQVGGTIDKDCQASDKNRAGAEGKTHPGFFDCISIRYVMGFVKV